MSEIIVIRCPMARHDQLGVPRVPLSLPRAPNLAVEKERDNLILQFLQAHAELRRQHGGPMLPTGVDPDWKLAEVSAEQPDVNAGATLCLELSREAPLVIPDPGKAHAARALGSSPMLAGEVDRPPTPPPAPGQPPTTTVPPVLGPGATPPPAATQPQGPTPDIRPAACGGPACVIVNGVEAHESATCPQGLGTQVE